MIETSLELFFKLWDDIFVLVLILVDFFFHNLVSRLLILFLLPLVTLLLNFGILVQCYSLSSFNLTRRWCLNDLFFLFNFSLLFFVQVIKSFISGLIFSFSHFFLNYFLWLFINDWSRKCFLLSLSLSLFCLLIFHVCELLLVLQEFVHSSLLLWRVVIFSH